MQRYCYGCLMRHDLEEFDARARKCRAYIERAPQREAARAKQAELLRLTRETMKLSERALALKLGISPAHYHNLEIGRREISEEMALEIATMLISSRREGIRAEARA